MRRHDAVAALRIASGGVISPASGRIASDSRVARSATASGRTGPATRRGFILECPGSRDVALASTASAPGVPKSLGARSRDAPS